jgi:hypothetical protein
MRTRGLHSLEKMCADFVGKKGLAKKHLAFFSKKFIFFPANMRE